ncbi:chemotaxis protein CheX [bacterium]|nr:chemotaxis protein CheX [bacterium]
MTNSLDLRLYRAAAQTFEELAFLFAYPQQAEAQSAAPTDVIASASFRGPLQGRVTVACPRSMLPAIARNMLGEAEDPPELQQLDALSEMANVVCGNLLPTLAPEGSVFHMEAPQVFEGDLLRAEDTPAARTRLEFDEGWAEVGLHLQDTRTADGGCR